MPSVGSLSVASRTYVCEHVINVLTRSTSSEKAAPGEPPWALDMFLILVPQMPTPEKGRPVSNLLVEGTDEQRISACACPTLYNAAAHPRQIYKL